MSAPVPEWSDHVATPLGLRRCAWLQSSLAWSPSSAPNSSQSVSRVVTSSFCMLPEVRIHLNVKVKLRLPGLEPRRGGSRALRSVHYLWCCRDQHLRKMDSGLPVKTRLVAVHVPLDPEIDDEHTSNLAQQYEVTLRPDNLRCLLSRCMRFPAATSSTTNMGGLFHVCHMPRNPHHLTNHLSNLRDYLSTIAYSFSASSSEGNACF